MPTTTGLLFSTIFGSAVRYVYTSIGGSPAKLSSKLIGYSAFVGSSVGVYLLVIDPTITSNQELFKRRLEMLREQREKRAEFYDFEPVTHENPYKRGSFFNLLDKFGAKYK
ncbi:hypothetical protein SBY92_003437 [Candida maltosa Xu316]